MGLTSFTAGDFLVWSVLKMHPVLHQLKGCKFLSPQGFAEARFHLGTEEFLNAGFTSTSVQSLIVINMGSTLNK